VQTFATVDSKEEAKRAHDCAYILLLGPKVKKLNHAPSTYLNQDTGKFLPEVVFDAHLGGAWREPPPPSSMSSFQGKWREPSVAVAVRDASGKVIGKVPRPNKEKKDDASAQAGSAQAVRAEACAQAGSAQAVQAKAQGVRKPKSKKRTKKAEASGPKHNDAQGARKAQKTKHVITPEASAAKRADDSGAQEPSETKKTMRVRMPQKDAAKRAERRLGMISRFDLTDLEKLPKNHGDFLRAAWLWPPYSLERTADAGEEWEEMTTGGDTPQQAGAGEDRQDGQEVAEGGAALEGPKPAPEGAK
jgi:hypothetical protein